MIFTKDGLKKYLTQKNNTEKMTDKKPTYSKKIIEIADYIFANPDKKAKDVISVYCGKFRKTERTIETYIAKAKLYNESRTERQENIKKEIEDEETKKVAKNAILTRLERLEILSNIAKGQARKISDEVVIPSDGDRIRAIAEISKMQGDYAPKEAKVSVTNVNELSEEQRKLLLNIGENIIRGDEH